MCVTDEAGIITNDSDHGPRCLARDQKGLTRTRERERGGEGRGGDLCREWSVASSEQWGNPGLGPVQAGSSQPARGKISHQRDKYPDEECSARRLADPE